MLGQIILSHKLLFFIGGVAAATIGAKCLNSEKARQLCVKGMAYGMRARDNALQTFQNIKEEAVDIYHDAKNQAGTAE